MPAPWKSVLVIAAVCVAVGPAADPPKPIQLPLTPFEVLALVHSEPSEEAVIRKLKDSGTRYTPSAPELRQLRQLGVSDRVLAAVMADPAPQVVQATFTTPLPPAKSGRPVGTWVREIGDTRIVLKFTEDRLTITANIPAWDGEMTMTVVDADYSINPEGLLFGVISGIDADQPKAVSIMQVLAGHTFSMRCRVEGNTMVMKDLKAFGSDLHPSGSNDDYAKAIQMACGRYTRDENAKPSIPKKATKPAEPTDNVPSTYLLPLPLRGSVNSTGGAPTEVRVTTGVDSPVRPTAAVDGCAITYPDPPAPIISRVPANASPLVGSWIRETEGTQLIAKFAEKRAFLTVNVAMHNGMQEYRMTARIEMDYAIGPDGTAFGVITGTDFIPPKSDPDNPDVNGSADMMSEILTSLHSVPFYFRFRTDEGNLTLRELYCGESLQRHTNARMILVGRYKPLGNQTPTPPKPVKMKQHDADPPGERIGVDFNRPETLPTPPHLKHPPQLFPPDSLFPLPRELDSTIRVREVAPAPRAVRR